MKITVLAEGRLAVAPFDIRTAIVSDLHGGDGGKSDNFQVELFMAFFDSETMEGPLDLVVVGDGFDGWETRYAADIVRHMKWFLDWAKRRFRRRMLIKGNHDGDGPFWKALRSLLNGWFLCDVFSTRSVLMEHGHRLDAACSGPGTWLGRTASRAWGWLEDRGWASRLDGVKRWAQRWAKRRLKTASKRKEPAPNAAYLAEFNDRPDAPVLYVTGHTHAAALEEHRHLPGRWYGNPNSWTTPGVGCAIIVEGAKIRLLKIEA